MEVNNKHALLGPSSSERWINCPPSARLCEDVEEQPSIYANEGSDAHALAAYKLERALGNKTIEYPTLTSFNKEMDEMTDSYVSFVLEKIEESKEASNETTPFTQVEHEVKYDKFVKDGFGTADCIVSNYGHLHIIDFKYGKGVKVDATNNSQLKLYALGAIVESDALFEYDTIELSIFQPRLSNISTWKTSKKELLEWANEVLVPAANLAYKGEGIFRSGAYCKFCKVKAICKERSKEAYKMLHDDFKDPNLLSDYEVEDILLKADDITAYLTDIKEYALTKALEGKKWVNFKLIEGRSNRKFSDEGAVVNILKENKVNPYEPKLRSLSDIEKELGKNKLSELLGSLVTKPQGKPSLVLRSDKREELNLAKNDFSEINGGN